jgi:hypothetical protein
MIHDVTNALAFFRRVFYNFYIIEVNDGCLFLYLSLKNGKDFLLDLFILAWFSMILAGHGSTDKVYYLWK